MSSLFDPVEDLKLPDERPKKSYKGLFKIVGLVVGLLVLAGGGYYLYDAYKPRKLTEKPVPASPDTLLTELKGARDDIDSKTRDIYARIEQFNRRMEMLGRKQVSFSQVFMQGLSADEEAALDKLVKEEKDPSYHGQLSQ